MWQPIETAPKDGTAIIVWDGSVIGEGLWIDSPDDNDHVGWCWAGWGWTGGVLHSLHCVMVNPPTHWMPLPDPPKD